jgi:hypothetical protein
MKTYASFNLPYFTCSDRTEPAHLPWYYLAGLPHGLLLCFLNVLNPQALQNPLTSAFGFMLRTAPLRLIHA